MPQEPCPYSCWPKTLVMHTVPRVPLSQQEERALEEEAAQLGLGCWAMAQVHATYVSPDSRCNAAATVLTLFMRTYQKRGQSSCPWKQHVCREKFKSSSKGLVVVPFYITLSFWYKQLPGDWRRDWAQPWKLSPWELCYVCFYKLSNGFFLLTQQVVGSDLLSLPGTNKEEHTQNMNFKPHGTSKYALVCSDFGRE